jgi:alpha-tubulin suppressor-like RCC1 family protein
MRRVQTPQEVMGIDEPVEYVATGHYHTLCVTTAGNLWAFGSNSKGQLGVKSAGACTRFPRLSSLVSCAPPKTVLSCLVH